MTRKMTRARRWFYFLFPFLCFWVFAYPVYRLAGWYGPHTAISPWQAALIWGVAVAALWYSFRSPKMALRYVMVHWLGASFILFALTAVYEALRLLLPVRDADAVLVILALAVLLVVLAVLASHFLGVKHLEFDSEKITQPHRIVQISDVHIGSRQGGYLARIVARINRLEPDVVVITGDLVDSSSVGHAQLRFLAGLRARTLFSVGNHERYAGLDNVIQLLTRLGVESLRQRWVMAGEIQVIGIDDADHHGQVADKLPSIRRRRDQYTVLLYHRPQGWEAAVEHGVDLMLSGHTHNGQIFPFNLLVKRQFNRIRGLYSQSGVRHWHHLYVSPGTGTWGPLMRLGSLNEITCIDVKPVPVRSD